MKKIITTLLAGLILPFFLEAEESKQTKSLANLLVESEEAKPIKRVDPKYPPSYAKDGTTGWVKLSYVVDEHGNAKDITPIDFSSGGKQFAREGKKAMRKWKFSPMKINGEAIESCHSVQFNFELGPKGMQAKNKAIVLSWLNAIAKQDLALMTEFKNKADKLKKLNSFERSWLKLAYASHYKITQNPEKEFEYLSKINIKYNLPSLPKSVQSQVIIDRYILSIKFEKYGEARRLYNLMEKEGITKSPEQLAILEEQNKLFLNFIQSDKPITYQPTVPEQGIWSHNLVRNAFSIHDIDGSLDKVDIRCSAKRNIYSIEPDNEWKIPASWGECSILIDGNPGTKFVIQETYYQDTKA